MPIPYLRLLDTKLSMILLTLTSTTVDEIGDFAPSETGGVRIFQIIPHSLVS